MNTTPISSEEGLPSTSTTTPNVQAALYALCLELIPLWGHHLAMARTQSQQAVDQMVHAFQAIYPVLQQYASEGDVRAQALQPEIERMFIGFQYQDRISQMLDMLRGDMARLDEMLKRSSQEPAELDVVTWLEHLESQYAMAEQRHPNQDATGSELQTGGEKLSFF